MLDAHRSKETSQYFCTLTSYGPFLLFTKKHAVEQLVLCGWEFDFWLPLEKKTLQKISVIKELFMRNKNKHYA